ncbi:hypothetical protein OQA88_9428 [Cercophora sp. LCS_1]
MSYERTPLPYFAKDLPAPLPTIEQIQDEKNHVLQTHRGNTVVRVGEHFVVKYGGDAHAPLSDGEMMLFVRRNCRVRVPTVYAIFRDEATKLNYLVMEYIAGKTLSELWPTLDEDAVKAYALQLRACLDELQGIPAPGYYGGFARTVFNEQCILRSTASPDESWVAVDTEEEFIDLIFAALQKRRPLESPRLKWMRMAVGDVWKGHRPVFTHGDLTPANIMVADDDGKFVLLDFATAGWYPEFWEYATSMISGWGALPKYCLWFDSGMKRYAAETAWLDIVLRWYAPLVFDS